ncbi:facilitated trehalose transporter Tret1-like [Culicoides brevitarsis]|uniref:facilitated trehalose transporter Tret1-like n=1 Tax=Culicoides brevitarsis TaxID=469753 RepID=UPI00307C8687
MHNRNSSEMFVFRPKGVFAQYYAIICANLMTLLYGIAAGWASNSLRILQSTDTPLTSGPLTLWESSWVGSILCVGGAIGQIFFSFMADRYGRKPGLAISFVPVVVSWLLIVFGQEFYALFVSRFLSGFIGGAAYQILPLLVSEVSNVEIRGILGSFLLLFTNLGILLGYIFCAFLPYRIVPWVAIGISCAFLVGFSIVPETPKYLMMKGGTENDEKLKNSVEFFSGKPFVKEITVQRSNEEPSSIKLKSLFDVSTRNAFRLSLLLMSCCCFSGVFTVLQYTETIFSEAGSNLSPSTSSIIVAVIQLAGSYFATIVVERAGRRILLLASSYGSAICLGVMGAHSFLKENDFDVSSFAWLPLLCLSLLLFIAANGATTVSFIVIGEVFAQNVRGLAISLCLLYQWMLAFVLVLVFPFLIQYLQMSGALWVFTAIGTVIASILVFILPETKGRTIDEIVDILGKNREKTEILAKSCSTEVSTKL